LSRIPRSRSARATWFHFTPRRWPAPARLGADPQTSVADGRRQLHDLPGVWVGDASALPTAPGVNPMITLMALAELTAQHMIGAG
jgi:choline dehydrogenase-like flavoprotein